MVLLRIPTAVQPQKFALLCLCIYLYYTAFYSLKLISLNITYFTVGTVNSIDSPGFDLLCIQLTVPYFYPSKFLLLFHVNYKLINVKRYLIYHAYFHPPRCTVNRGPTELLYFTLLKFRVDYNLQNIKL